MNLVASYLQGASLGLVLAVQVGPISLLCVRQALGHGLKAGVAVGVGATLADFLYASIAALGLGGLGRGLASWTGAIQAMGGALLVVYGYRGWRARHQPAAAARVQAGRRAFAASFMLTLTNPLTILFFASVLAGLGVAGHGPAAGLAVAAGLATTTLVWMAGLALLADRAGRWLSPSRLVAANGVASLLLAALGVGLVVRAVT